MTIDDDIFDITEVLARTQEEDTFGRIIQYIATLEIEYDKLSSENYTLKKAIKIVQET